jgi:LemA protein
MHIINELSKLVFGVLFMWNIIAFVLVVLSIVFLGAMVVGIYNNLVKLRNRVENAWSDINVELERRASLIDNLVITVQGYAAHEKSTLKEVTEARSRLIEAGTVKENAKANRKLTRALDNLFAVAENYPELKADDSFLKLMDQLAKTEDLIADYRQYYNDMVYIYNNKCQMFPSNVVASYFGFEDAEFFEPGADATEFPGLNFNQSLEEESVTQQ